MPLYETSFNFGDEVYVISTNQIGIIQGINLIDTKTKSGYRTLTEKYLVKPKEKSIYSYNWAIWYTKDKLELREPTPEDIDCYQKSINTDITILYSQIDTCLDHIRDGIEKQYYRKLLDAYRLEVKHLLEKYNK